MKIILPKPYQEVGSVFIISGTVPKKYMETSYGIDNRIFMELIDIDGHTFMGGSIDVNKIEIDNCLPEYKDSFHFLQFFPLHHFSSSFIAKSQGRITLMLSGQKEDEQSVFIPIIVKELLPKECPDPKILNRHGKIGEIVKQYKKDIKDYYKELENVNERRKQKSGLGKEDESIYQYGQDWEITEGVLNIFEQAEGFNENYPFAKEDKEEEQLKEKYKDALEWQGPLCTGIIGRINGFEFQVYSNDHDKHFHVIHRGKGINARFSFPEIELINYKNTRNSINSREKNKVIAFFKNPENFKKLEKEFQRRDSVY